MEEVTASNTTSTTTTNNNTAILIHNLDTLLAARHPPKTFCPSEVARACSSADLQRLGFAGWREAMPAVRALVWDVRERGECEVLQRGEVLGADVALEDVRGPIRVRRKGE